MNSKGYCAREKEGEGERGKREKVSNGPSVPEKGGHMRKEIFFYLLLADVREKESRIHKKGPISVFSFCVLPAINGPLLLFSSFPHHVRSDRTVFVVK